MPLEHPDPDTDAAALYRVVPAHGGTISNPAAQRELGWNDDRYWVARDDLEDQGLIVRGRGRGGTLRRAVLDATGTEAGQKPTSSEGEESPEVTRELALYEPMAAVLKGDWAKDHRVDPLGVEITALQGGRSTGGTWSRPDIVSVEIKTYEYVPGKYLEVVTYEVKPVDAVNVSAVYEALAHRRASTRACVLLHVPAEHAPSMDETIDAVRKAARPHGIGVVAASDPSDYDTWEELEEASRVEPDPDRLDEFIRTQLSSALRNRIARMLR